MTSRRDAFRPFGLLARASQAEDRLEARREARESQQLEAAVRAERLAIAGDEGPQMLDSIEATRERLAHARPGVRRCALYLLVRHWKEQVDRATPILLRMLSDADPDVRREAIEHLASLWERSQCAEIARILSEIVADADSRIDLRRAAYTALRLVMGLNIFRYGVPSDVAIPEQVDWDLVTTCLRGERFSISDEEDLPLQERMQRLGSPHLRAAIEEFKRGMAAFYRGEYSEAAARYSAVLRYTPDAPGALHMRGCAYGNLGEIDAALSDFTAAIEMKSDDPIYYRERAEAYRRRGLHELAEVDEQMASGLLEEHRIN